MQDNQQKPLETLREGLDGPAREALEACIDICADAGVSLFIVGGAVRDLLLERGAIDLDLAMEADTAPIARELAARTGGKVTLHERFGTATVKGEGFEIDLARTRSESYEKPGALPDVAPARLIDDLRRRDFTINAMALRLTEPAGELVDPYSGAKDLKSRLLRVLHDASFQDDATRILRAMRYIARLNFKIDRRTENLLTHGLRYVDTISAARLRRELVLMFEEPTAARAALLADQNGVLRAVSRALSIDEDLAVGWADAMLGTHHGPLDELGFCLITRPEHGGVVDTVSERLHLAGRFEKALRDFVRLRGLFDKLSSVRNRPADAVELLDGVEASAIWAMSIADTRSGGQACEMYLREWRKVRPRLSGHDLQELGVAQGAGIGDMLRMLRRARLEGRADTRDEEIQLVRTQQGA